MKLRFGNEGRSVIAGRLTWSNNPISKLKNVEAKIANRILRKGTVAGARIFKRALKTGNTPKRTGGLRLAMWEKVYRPKGQKGIAKFIGVAGPRSKFERTLGVRTRGRKKGQPILYKPGKILQLLERGFRTRGGGRFAGLHFMQLAFTKNWNQARAEMLRVIGDEVNKELAKGK